MKTSPFGALSTVATYVTDIAVNGSTQDSFKQADKATYDVDISTSYSASPREDPTHTMSRLQINTSSGETCLDAEIGDGGGGSVPKVKGQINSNSDGRNIEFEFRDAYGNTIATETISGSFNETAEYDGVGRVIATDKSGGSDNYDVGAVMRDNQTISSSYTVNGVTQS